MTILNICDYGCGKEGKYQFKNGKWCCEDFYSKCSKMRKKNSERQKGKINNKPKYIENSTHICDYGCGREAKFQFKNGNWCCENNIAKCSNVAEITVPIFTLHMNS